MQTRPLLIASPASTQFSLRRRRRQLSSRGRVIIRGPFYESAFLSIEAFDELEALDRPFERFLITLLVDTILNGRFDRILSNGV